MRDDWLGQLELDRGLMMPREKPRARRPDDLIERKAVAFVVPTRNADVLVVIGQRHLSKAARIVVEQRIG